MNDETKQELSSVSEEETTKENSGAESGETGSEIQNDGEAGDSSEVSKVGQDESDTIQDDGSGRSDADSEKMGQAGEEEEVDADELEKDNEELEFHPVLPSSVHMPEGVQTCVDGQGQVCLRVSAKYAGGWVPLTFDQWEKMFSQVRDAFGERTK